jgi:hypothetical protein
MGGIRNMKKLILIFSLLAVVNLWADTPLKNVTITGTTSQIASGTFNVKTGVVVTYESGASAVFASGSTLDVTAATLKVGTITGATNANVKVDANGTGKFEIDDTVTTGTNQDLVVAPNGTGKLDLRAAPLKAGTATAGTAPVKFTAGTNLTTPENGAVEYDGTNFFYTAGGVRKTFLSVGDAVAESVLTFTDITTNNVSTSKHGFQKKLSGNSYEYAGGDGNYSIPSQVPLNTQNAAYTFVLTDAGKTIFHDEVTARVYTIPANSSVAYPIGTTITVINNTGGGTLTLSITTDTLRRGDGTAGTGNRTITADSAVTIIKTKSTEWMITGKFS